MISVVIPTYKSPEALDVCLSSAVNGQDGQNEIIVVVDGFLSLNESVLQKYADVVSVLDLSEISGS